MKQIKFIAENGSLLMGIEVPKDAITFSLEMEDHPQLSYYSKIAPESEGKSIDPMVCTIPYMGKVYGTFDTKTNKFNFKIPSDWVKRTIPLDGYFDPDYTTDELLAQDIHRELKSKGFEYLSNPYGKITPTEHSDPFLNYAHAKWHEAQSKVIPEQLLIIESK